LNCEEDMLWETFSYMNCALQHEKLNRGVWKTLEERERELSRQSGLMAEVFIEVDFTENPDRVPGGAAIPYGFYKEIFIGDLRECYWFKNEAPQSKNLNKYECECRN
jgi:DNA/RNA endonuclease G (NUC1)